MVASARRHSLGRVDDQQGYVRGFQVAAGHDHAQLLGHQVRLALAANAGRIDEAKLRALELDHFVHGIAGGPGDGRDNGAGGSGESVEQRGLADVGTADDGDGGLVLLEFTVGAMEEGRQCPLPLSSLRRV